MMTILLTLLLALTIGLSFEVFRLRKISGKNREVTREQIEAQLKELEWVDFEDGNLLAQTGLPLDGYIQRYNNKYLASGKRTTYLENNIALITLTAEEAKKELRAWQVEQVYRLFKHD